LAECAWRKSEKQLLAQRRHYATFRHAAQVGGFQSKEFELPSGRLARRLFLSLRFSCAAGA